MTTKEMAKSLPVSKQMVYNSYLKVLDKDGGAGIDRQTIELFKENMPGNLYKIYNRMSSGSYFPPPVRTVFIPKKQGGLRPLGIPTVGDRVAQGVVKDYLEPGMEAIFHRSSFGYRPGRSAHDALQQCRTNCLRYSWVIDVDIKGFFDNINHEMMLQLLGLHTQEKWILMYTERWLKAGVEQEDGSILARTKGTPQGGVISPLLANIYLHHAFDKWMDEHHLQNPFERYADDIIIHCDSKEVAETLLAGLSERMHEFGLELHPEKTKLVYCKDDNRKESHDEESFVFLSYSFQPRNIWNNSIGETTRIKFGAAICSSAKTSIRQAMKTIVKPGWTGWGLEWFAKQLNPKIRGWVNYYTRYYRHETLKVFFYLNGLIRKWLKKTHKLTSNEQIMAKYKSVQQARPSLFYHWQLGIKA